MRHARWPVAAVGTILLATPAAAHTGGLTLEGGSASVPLWLFLLTGGGVVGASFLLTSLVTDRDLIRQIDDWGLPAPVPAAVRGRLAGGGAALAVVGLVAVVAAGLFGPADPRRNVGVLVVWVGWWAGYVMSVYLLGNTWPALNPWRALASRLPSLSRSRARDVGRWPGVVGLLALIWLEVVSPVSSAPRLLAGVIVGYTLVTLAGAAAVGVDTWFGSVDPVARTFRQYGRIAPIQRRGGGFELSLPGLAATDDRDDDALFVVALLWVTTYDGLVSTPAWADLVAPVVEAGVPPLLVYLVAIVGGFGAFAAVYRVAAARVRESAPTYVAAAEIRSRFVPALLPIAAGYHLAHFLGYFLALSPALFGALLDPLSPPAPEVLVVPGWFGGLSLGFVILGHLFGVWIAHAVSFDLFSGRLQPIRSQYPFIVVMVLYTMTSLWIVSQPSSAPPYV